MQQFERDILEYRPHLSLQRRLGVVVDLTQVTPDVLEQLPVILTEALKITPSDVLDNIARVETKMSVILGKLSNCLQNKTINGVRFDDYKTAKQTGDYETVSKFESYCNSNINSTTSAEAVIYLLDINDLFIDHKEYVNQVFYDGKVNYSDILQYRKQEDLELSQLISSEIKNPNTQDLTEISIRTQLLQAANVRIDNIANFLECLDSILNHGVMDQLPNIPLVLSELIKGGENNVQKLNEIDQFRFKKLAFTSYDNRSRFKRLNTKDIRNTLKDEVDVISNLRINHVPPLATWLQEVNNRNRDASVNKVLMDTVDGMEILLDTYTQKLTDLHKANNLENMQFQDILDNLLSKKQARQLYRITDILVKQVNFDSSSNDSSLTAEVKRFIANNALDKPGSYCE